MFRLTLMGRVKWRLHRARVWILRQEPGPWVYPDLRNGWTNC